VALSQLGVKASERAASAIWATTSRAGRNRIVIEAMHDQLERCFPGWDGLVLHEKISPTVHLDVMVVRPTAACPCLRLVTCGMAELPMHVPPEWSETPYAELSIALPPSWPVSMEASATSGSTGLCDC
jgi:hypothetical protein